MSIGTVPFYTPYSTAAPSSVIPGWGSWPQYQAAGWDGASLPSSYWPQASYSTVVNPANLLVINYTNDTHEKYRRIPNLVTGFKTHSDRARATGADVFNAAAGDWNISNESNEMELNVLLHNLMGIDASTYGNHEYDGGTDPLAQAMKRANFPIFALNIDMHPASQLGKRIEDGHISPTARVFVSQTSGQRYGVIGVTVPNLKSYLNPKYSQSLDLDSKGLQVAIHRIQQEVNRMESMGVNRIIMVSHMGYEADKAAAKAIAGVDIIVGGHSHTELKGIKAGVNFVQSSRGEPVVILQTGKDAHALGELWAYFTPWGTVVPMSNTLYDPNQFAKDTYAQQLIDSYLGKATPIGQIAQDISTENARAGGENAFTNKMADLIRDYTQADIGLIRGTDVRNDLEAGEFTDRDLKILLPFNDPVVKLKLSGKEMMAVLNNSGRALKDHNGHPGIIIGGGLRYKVDAATGNVVEALVMNQQTKQWQPLNPKQSYSVGVGSFVITNRTEWPMFKSNQLIQSFPYCARDIFGEWMRRQQNRPVRMQLDGRIQLVQMPTRR